MDSLLPNSISQSKVYSDIEKVLLDELASIAIEQCMMMLVDVVSSAALPFLAAQFDVLGYSGYKFATTDLQRRAIIKQAIELKRYMGTVWAIEQALSTVGYTGASIVEGSGTVGDGNDWARFRIVSNLGLNPLDGNTATELAGLINKYKNKRSELVSIDFTMDISELLPLPKEIINIDYHVDITDSLFTGGLKLDGSWKLNGTKKLKPGVEDLQITIII